MPADGLIRPPEEPSGRAASPQDSPTSTELTTAMVHLYRAEVQRANVWRQRLDATTNWAVITSGAAISIAFSGEAAHHGLIVLENLLITSFLIMEAYRFRYYQVWSSRARWLEANYFAGLLAPDLANPDWRRAAADQLLHPAFNISFREALLRRLGRSYIWIYLLLFVAWSMKLALFPTPANSLLVAVHRAGMLGVPGEMVAGLYLFVILTMIGAFLFTLRSYGMFTETLAPADPTPPPENPKTPH